MEAKVWSDPEVLRRLRENFVIIALYVDDRTQLPENEWLVSALDGKQKKTIGKINEELRLRSLKQMLCLFMLLLMTKVIL